jgi:hypothetical protein
MYELMELPQTFWDKVNKTDTCWLWTGAAQQAGRVGSKKLQGRYRHNGKAVLTHKLSLETHLGRPLAPGMVTRHKCRSDLCVNPDHLEEGTQAENVWDMIRDGTHHGTILTDDQVREIRASDKGPTALGLIYGMDRSNIRAVKSGKTYSWVV